MKKVFAVGSENPSKVKACELALRKIFPDIQLEIVGCKAKSGVSDQPMSDEESITGMLCFFLFVCMLVLFF